MNKVLTLTLLLALTLGASAQQKPAVKKPAGKTPKKTAEIQVSTGTAAAGTKEPGRSAKIIEGLKAWDASLETLQADFTQEVNFREAGLKQSIEGTLRYVKPNLLRIEHAKPARQVVVTDKTAIWIYKPEDKQAVRTSWEAWRRAQDQNFSGILDFGNYAALADRNLTTAGGGENGQPFKVTFRPMTGGDYTLTLTLSATDYFPLEAELLVDNTVIKTRLSSVEKNGPIDGEIFKFSPPKGVEVLEFKN
ncbi:MAG TPA: hypothetical protein DCS63_04500 [Elusimicrobia bacterium]|nr:hypothetical protein [Elusimicrobiota bacterium]